MKNLLKKTAHLVLKKSPTLGKIIYELAGRTLRPPTQKNIYGEHNQISHDNARLTSVVFNIYGDHNTIEIEKGCVLKKVKFIVRGDHHQIRIGKGVRFHHGGGIWFEDHHGSLHIGENTTFEAVHLAITEPYSKITIGKECMFAYDIDVRTGDSHSILSTETNQPINPAQDVCIGDHVWVAAHSLILKGVHLPENSVVAGGAVVTKPFETPGIIIGGNPAKQIKENITWSRQRIYTAS